MQVVSGEIFFGPFSGAGPRADTQDVALANPTTTAVVLLAGMDVSFSNNNDHHLGNLQVGVAGALLNRTTVRVTATYGLRDWSGNWDDEYEGVVQFTVVAD